MDKRLTLWILAGMILGVVVGYAVHVGIPQDNAWFEYLTKTARLQIGRLQPSLRLDR